MKRNDLRTKMFLVVFRGDRTGCHCHVQVNRCIYFAALMTLYIELIVYNLFIFLLFLCL